VILEIKNFDLLNKKDIPRYYYYNRFSILDLTLAMTEVSPLISNCTIDEDNPISSNHEVIQFEITSDSDNQSLSLTAKNWNAIKADWEGFSKYLTGRMESSSDIWITLHQ
jgi:hypothetical protein